MMDTQRLVLWVIFSMSLLFLWDSWQKHNGHGSLFFSTPTATQTAKPATPAANGNAPGGTQAAPGADAAPTGSANTPAAVGEIHVLANDVLRLSINTRGAVVERGELIKHKATDNDKQAFVLLENAPGKPYVAEGGVFGVANAPNHQTMYSTTSGTVELAPGQDAASMSFVAESGGLRVTRSYSLPRGAYAVQVKTTVENLSTEPVNPSIYAHLRRHAESASQASFFAGPAVFTGPVVYTDQDKFQKVSFSDIEKGKAKFSGSDGKALPDGWVGLIQHYFVSAWVPPEKTERQYYAEKAANPGEYRIGFKQALGSIAPGAKAEETAALLIAPQDQYMLAKVAPGLDLVVDYSWLTLVAKPMFHLLTWLHTLVGNWGWAIVLLTIIIKALFYLPMAASYKSMAKMKQVTPKMTALREKYGDDKLKLNQAMMELYKTEKLNPLGGCLPIVITIPVFLALYWVLLASVEMRHAPWILWVNDLASPDHLYILPVILAVTMWAQFKLSPQPPDPMQARVMLVMQAVFAVMFLFFPSGLVLYYIVNNVLSIAQQKFIYMQLEKKGYKMR